MHLIHSHVTRYFRIRYIIIFLLSIALLGYLVYRFNVLTQTMNFYYRVLNPQAGAVQLEKIYKDNSDGAESMRIQANFAVV